MIDVYWSKFAHSLVLGDGNYCVFNSINFSVVQVNINLNPKVHQKLTAEELESIDSDTLENFRKYNIVIDDIAEDNAVLSKLLSDNNSIDIKNLILLISNECNMNCNYCQIENNIYGQKVNMTLGNAMKALEYFESVCNVQGLLTINFTGGEPLLNFEVIRAVVDYTKNSKKLLNARLVIFTNGTLITTDIANFLKNNNFLVIVSLDGKKENHDEFRKYHNGVGTYDDALRGYILAKSAGCNCAISSVANLVSTDFDAYLEWLIDLNPLSVGINYAHLILNQNNPQNDFQIYTTQIIKANEMLSIAGISLENYNRFNNFFVRKEVRRRECQACGRGITIDSRGMIGPCKSLLVSDKISFSLDGFVIEKSKMFCQWAERTPLHNETCLLCPAVAICGGGCAYDSFCLFNGDAMKMDDRMCSHIKTIFNDLMIRGLVKESMSATTDETDYKMNIIDSVGH